MVNARPSVQRWPEISRLARESGTRRAGQTNIVRSRTLMSRVHIELERVQTWLFTVPRLRAMVGATVLLGETLRVALPKLARETGRWALAPTAEAYPTTDPDDPLKAYDDPAADALDGT